MSLGPLGTWKAQQAAVSSVNLLLDALSVSQQSLLSPPTCQHFVSQCQLMN